MSTKYIFDYMTTPLIVHQTWKTKDISSFKNYHKTFYDIKWLTKKIYDDNDIDEYVKNNFSYFYDFFKSMNKMIERVDFFRYCVMYKEGGVLFVFICHRP